MSTSKLLLFAVTFHGAFGKSLPLRGSPEYYTDARACQLPLDCFWFDHGMNLHMTDLAPSITIRCPNITRKVVDEEIARIRRRRIKFVDDFHTSLVVRQQVYSSLDKHGVTYNNCTTPVDVSQFPKQYRIFLCTESVQLHLKQEQERNRCEDLWFDNALQDSDTEKCKGFIENTLQRLRGEETEAVETSMRVHSLTITSVTSFMLLTLILLLIGLALHMWTARLPHLENKRKSVAYMIHEEPWPLQESSTLFEDKEVEAKPVVAEKGTQSRQYLPLAVEVGQVSDHSNPSEEELQIGGQPEVLEDNSENEEGWEGFQGARSPRKRIPGRTRQREARRRKNRTPSPQ